MVHTEGYFQKNLAVNGYKVKKAPVWVGVLVGALERNRTNIPKLLKGALHETASQFNSYCLPTRVAT